MMDTLFRGKDIETGKWIYGWVFGEKAKSIIELDSQYISKEGTEAYYTSIVHPETVGQYIGTDDKNSSRIFEGDVVKVIRDSGSGEWEVKIYIENVRRIPSELYGSAVVEIQVIGNIHDNPELMEGKNENHNRT